MIMAEYIRKDLIMKYPIRRNHYDVEHGNIQFINGIESVFEYIEDLPVAEFNPDMSCNKDYNEVKHAKWEICSDGYYPYCSACWREPQGREMTKFCPNCGAKMDL